MTEPAESLVNLGASIIFTGRQNEHTRCRKLRDSSHDAEGVLFFAADKGDDRSEESNL